MRFNFHIFAFVNELLSKHHKVIHQKLTRNFFHELFSYEGNGLMGKFRIFIITYLALGTIGNDKEKVSGITFVTFSYSDRGHCYIVFWSATDVIVLKT